MQSLSCDGWLKSCANDTDKWNWPYGRLPSLGGYYLGEPLWSYRWYVWTQQVLHSAQDFKCCLLICIGCISSQIMPMQKHENALCLDLREVHNYSSRFSGNQGGVGGQWVAGAVCSSLELSLKKNLWLEVGISLVPHKADQIARGPCAREEDKPNRKCHWRRQRSFRWIECLCPPQIHVVKSWPSVWWR